MPGAIIGFLAGELIGAALVGEVFAGTVLTEKIGGVAVGAIVGKGAGAIIGSAVDAALAPRGPDPISTGTPDGRLDDTPVIEATEPVQANLTERVQAAGRLVTVRQPIAPWQWIYGEVRVGGDITFAHATSDGTLLHLVVTLAGHESYAIGALYFDGELIPTNVEGYATGRHLGYVLAAASVGDPGVQPFPGLVLESEGRWTEAHRQDGRTKVWMRLGNNPDLFPAGVPNITLVVKGRKVYDPRSAVTTWSSNVALCVADYFVNVVGVDYATGIDEDLLIAAANICDETVTLADGSTEARYACNGSFRVSETPKSVLERLLAAMTGWAVNVGGKWRIYAGAYNAPSVSLDESHLTGQMRIQSLVSRRDNANGVKGVFVDPNQSWQPTDFPPVAPATYLAEDSGERVWKDLDYSGIITSGTQAQRNAKIELLRLRQGLTVSATYNLSAFRAMAGGTVSLTDTQLGWNNKVFDVLGSSFVIDAGGALGVRLDMRETAAAIYDWSTSEEGAIDIAPNTSLPNPFTVTAPVNVRLASGDEELILAGDGTVVSRIRVDWDAFDTDASVVCVLCQYKKFIDSVWIDAPAALMPSTTLWVSPVDDGYAYDVRVRAMNAFGVRSAWVQPPYHIVIGKTEPPADVMQFVIKGARLFWTAVADIDVAGYRVRYQPGTTRNWGRGLPMHEGLLTASPFDMPVRPPGVHSIMIKAVDTTGNESANPAVIITDLGDAIVANVVETFDLKAAGFVGTKTDCSVAGGDLVADVLSSPLMWNPNSGTNLWADVSATLMWATTMYRAMSDVESVTTTAALAGSRMTIAHTITGDPWSIEYRENSAKRLWGLDDAALMWGADDSLLFWDDPAWLPWPGEIVAENSIYEIRVSAGQSTEQGQVTELTVTIDAPDLTEQLNDVAILAAGTRLVLTEDFGVIKNIQLTVQAAAGGAISARTEDKSVALGPLVKCYDAGGVAVNGLVDAVVQGY